jgi:signal transduction histidine kinase
VDAERAEHELDATQQVLRDAMGELRATLAVVRMPILPDEDVGQVLARSLRQAAQRAGWQVTCDVDGGLGDVDERTREALLRIGLEALTNAERHAHARHVTLALTRTDDQHVALRVTDDGAGLDMYVSSDAETAHGDGSGSQSPSGHYGLTGMHERAAALGGTVRVFSPPSGGTVVLACLPCHAETALPETALAPHADELSPVGQSEEHEASRRR